MIVTTASVRKESKCSTLPSDYIFQWIVSETLGPLNASALNFLSEDGRRLSSLSGDPRETSFLFQRLSMIVQRSTQTSLCIPSVPLTKIWTSSRQ